MTLPKPCHICGKPGTLTGTCPAHTPKRANTTARGYGAAHQAERKRRLRAAYGTPCPHCGYPMLQGQALDLDHTDDRLGYVGITHAICNRGRRRNP